MDPVSQFNGAVGRRSYVEHCVVQENITWMISSCGESLTGRGNRKSHPAPMSHYELTVTSQGLLTIQNDRHGLVLSQSVEKDLADPTTFSKARFVFHMTGSRSVLFIDHPTFIIPDLHTRHGTLDRCIC